MRVIICDDEGVQAELIHSYVEEYAQLRKCLMDIAVYASADQLYFDLDNFDEPDILLLDIQMQGMNGVELAERIRERNEHCVILFITGVVSYVYDSFQLKALNYLLKPLKKDQLFHCLDQACDQLVSQDPILTVIEDKEIYKLNVSSLYYAESEGHYVLLYTSERVYRMKKTMKDLECELPSMQFYRLTRSYLINLDAVDKITPKEIHMGSYRIPMPKGKYREVSQAFIQRHFKAGE